MKQAARTQKTYDHRLRQAFLQVLQPLYCTTRYSRTTVTAFPTGTQPHDAVHRPVDYISEGYRVVVDVIASFDLNEDGSWAFVATYDTDRLGLRGWAHQKPRRRERGRRGGFEARLEASSGLSWDQPRKPPSSSSGSCSVRRMLNSSSSSARMASATCAASTGRYWPMRLW